MLQKRWTKYKDAAIASAAAENARALPGAASADALKAMTASASFRRRHSPPATLFPTEAYDDGYRAIFAQSGVTPWNSVLQAGQVGEADRMAVAGPLVALAAGGDAAKQLPAVCAGLVCTKVEYTGHDTEDEVLVEDGEDGGARARHAKFAAEVPARRSGVVDRGRLTNGPGDRGVTMSADVLGPRVGVGQAR